MLVEKLFNSELSTSRKSYPAERELYREIVRYLCKGSTSGKLTKAARKCDAYHKVKTLKKTYLDESEYTLSRFWRAVFSTQTKECETCVCYADCKRWSPLFGTPNGRRCGSYKVSSKRIHKLYGVEKQDLTFALDNLTKKDKQDIVKRSKRYTVKTPNYDKEEVYLELYRWCKGLVFKRMKFIIDSNFDLELEDLAHDLMLAAWKRCLQCDSIGSAEHLKNAMKKRINQMAVNTIKFYNAEKRARLVKVNEEFKLKTLSLDYEYEKAESAEDTLRDAEFFSEEDRGYEKVECEEYVGKVLAVIEVLDPDYQRFAKILLGMPDREFETYISRKSVKSDDQYIEMAEDFLQVSRTGFVEKIKGLGFQI